MSTAYYGFAEPVTSIRPEVLGGHTHLGIWVNHAKAGTIVLRNEEARVFISLFRGPEIMHSHWGGSEKGSIVTGGESEEGDRLLVSEYGEILTVDDVRKRQGSKRQNGMPTELFGYEADA